MKIQSRDWGSRLEVCIKLSRVTRPRPIRALSPECVSSVLETEFRASSRSLALSRDVGDL